MTGQEFFEKVTKNPRYKHLYEENIHFNTQMQYLKSKPKVLTSTLLGSIAYLSVLLMYQDLEKIRESDNEIGDMDKKEVLNKLKKCKRMEQ